MSKKRNVPRRMLFELRLRNTNCQDRRGPSIRLQEKAGRRKRMPRNGPMTAFVPVSEAGLIYNKDARGSSPGLFFYQR